MARSTIPSSTFSAGSSSSSSSSRSSSDKDPTCWRCKCVFVSQRALEQHQQSRCAAVWGLRRRPEPTVPNSNNNSKQTGQLQNTPIETTTPTVTLTTTTTTTTMTMPNMSTTTTTTTTTTAVIPPSHQQRNGAAAAAGSKGPGGIEIKCGYCQLTFPTPNELSVHLLWANDDDNAGGHNFLGSNFGHPVARPTWFSPKPYTTTPASSTSQPAKTINTASPKPKVQVPPKPTPVLQQTDLLLLQCDCGKEFRDMGAMAQHKRDSLAHKNKQNQGKKGKQKMLPPAASNGTGTGTGAVKGGNGGGNWGLQNKATGKGLGKAIPTNKTGAAKAGYI
ncbi:hypothetical protein QBC46DRAFT_389775 [Diplogelasinospora grovesii]|uniref:Uncharacterized protein n=1 Tax=Diplogelasinospora grovesii TaxID=303347 RepID=A0AAN6N738_9PEZI|nr:hypothetical protein QBC46DRAFT_389775 [Diplogelasinospora grovesii]